MWKRNYSEGRTASAMVERGFSFDEILPAVVAHRGASVDHPENTLEAFEAAIEVGADAIELDVRLSVDGVAVVMHDADVARTTDGRGLVHEMTFPQVKRLNIYVSGRPDSGVPSLAEALDLLSGRAGVDLEIKNIPGQPGYEAEGESVVEATVRELERTGFRGPVIVSSFNPGSIGWCRRIAPTIPTGLLSVEPLPAADAIALAREAGHGWAFPSVRSLSEAGPGLVRRAHGSGMRVGTWTVDDEPTLERLLSWGVDAVATNDPATAVKVRQGWRVRTRDGGS